MKKKEKRPKWHVEFKFIGNRVAVQAVKNGQVGAVCLPNIHGTKRFPPRPGLSVKAPDLLARLFGATLQKRIGKVIGLGKAIDGTKYLRSGP